MEELRFDVEVAELSNFHSKKNVSSEGLFELVKLGLLKCIAGGGDILFKDKKSMNFGDRSLSSLDKNNDSSPFFTRPKKLHGTCNICCNALDNVSEKSELSSDESIEYQFDKSKSNSDTYNNYSALNLLAFLAILVTKTIGFQFSVVLSLITFPIWLSYCSFMFFMFPLQTLVRVKNHFSKMLYLDFSVSVLSANLGAKKSIMRLGRAMIVSIYVCSVLFGLLVFGFVIGSFAMRHIVEEPITARESLHFDYTKNSPVVFVPVMAPTKGDVVVPFEEVGRPVSARFIPYNRKIKLALSLTMPESDYNMKLGMFQVRMELLSTNGKVTATSTSPSMLRYKTRPIRTVQTLLKAPQLIFGHHTESQTLDVKMSNFIEGPEPTACFKVTLEQRAEFQRGAGIPEIYEASLLIESELPKFKKMVWDWRRTVFVWVSIMSFLTELVFFYVFFRWVIVPNSTSGSGIVVAKMKSDVPVTVSRYKTI